LTVNSVVVAGTRPSPDAVIVTDPGCSAACTMASTLPLKAVCVDAW